MSDCIFCKIVSGEIPAERIIEDPGFIAIRDIQPKAPQHVLVIPREHVASLNDVTAWDQDRGRDLLSLVVEAADAVGIRDTGYRVVVNTGRDARQVVQHLHVHVMGGTDLGD
jgi:histidine triad (HIT) family protein